MKDLPAPDPRASTADYKAYWLPRFQQDAREPLVWAGVAERLLFAAQVLRGAVPAEAGIQAGDELPQGWDLPPVYIMLLAFAAENLLKGILVGRDLSRVEELGLAKWQGGGHDLRALAHDAHIELTPDQEALLLNMSVFGEWLGRYPCPLKHEHRLPRPSPGGGFGPPGGLHSNDPDVAIELCARFARILHSERSTQ